MIYGRNQKIENVDGLIDYIGVPYPEGFIKNDMIFYFNHASVDKILYSGYVDENELLLRKYICNQINIINNA